MIVAMSQNRIKEEEEEEEEKEISFLLRLFNVSTYLFFLF